MMASRRILLLLIAILLLLLFLAVPGVSWADSLEDAARNLARKIAAALPAQQGVAVEFINSSTLSAAQATQVRRAIESELATLGHRGSEGEPSIHVRLTENPENFLIVVKFQSDTAPQVAITSVPRIVAQVLGQVPSSILIEKELVLDQAGGILDFAPVARFDDASPALVVLESGRLAVYARRDQVWELYLSQPLPSQKTWPRDARGWIQSRGGQIELSMPGLYCQKGLEHDLLWHCIDSASPTSVQALMRSHGWRGLGEFFETRNFFKAWRGWNGQWSDDFYYTASSLSGGSSRQVILAGLDGQATLYTYHWETRKKIAGWGSEIAGITSKCGSGRQVLATRPGDWTVPDAVQAYEIVDGQAVVVGMSIQFAGPVMALWTSEDESSVRAVVRNLKTEHYEAYRLTISCGK
jgi:hypothetical protein